MFRSGKKIHKRADIISVFSQLKIKSVSLPEPRLARLGWRWVLAGWVVAVVGLAFCSPVETVDSDAALTLLAAQAVLDHHSLQLDPYRDRCAYDLTADYRVRQHRGATYYYNLGSPLLSVPAVWISNRLGYHMLDQQAEFALQNVLSALLCGTVLLLLYSIGCSFVRPASALAISLVTLLGSSLISTLATSLWNLGYAVVLLLLALRKVVQWEMAGTGARSTSQEAAFQEVAGTFQEVAGTFQEVAGTGARSTWTRVLGLGGLLVAAFLCRPTAIFFAFGLLAAIMVRSRLGTWLRAPRVWPWAVTAVLALALAGLGLGNSLLSWLSLPDYYSPRRLLQLETPLGQGLYGNLLSPSRGLLVFSPFVAPVLFGVMGQWRRIRTEPLTWLALGWGSSHLLAVSLKGVWWGGFSYGPRLLAELLLPIFLLTLLVWRQLAAQTGRPRSALRAAYLGLGAVAILLHSYLGLWNPATVRWNQDPSVDRYPQLLFWWRYPQFLATAERLAARSFEFQQHQLATYRLGEVITPASQRAIFVNFSPPESAESAPEATWRWTTDQRAEIFFRLSEPLAGPHLLELTWGAQGEQAVSLELNRGPLGTTKVSGFAPTVSRWAVAGDRFSTTSLNQLSFNLPDAQKPSKHDDRWLGVALRALRLERLAVPSDRISFGDDPYFLDGWSAAESGWRWSAGPHAVVVYPLAQTATPHRLEVVAGTLDRQRLTLSVQGQVAWTGTLQGFAPQTLKIEIPGAWLQSDLVRLEFELPDAHSTPTDSRRLGLAVVHLRLHAQQAGRAGAP